MALSGPKPTELSWNSSSLPETWKNVDSMSIWYLRGHWKKEKTKRTYLLFLVGQRGRKILVRGLSQTTNLNYLTLCTWNLKDMSSQMQILYMLDIVQYIIILRKLYVRSTNLLHNYAFPHVIEKAIRTPMKWSVKSERETPIHLYSLA